MRSAICVPYTVGRQVPTMLNDAQARGIQDAGVASDV